jgi:hypothetical protein
MTTGMKVLLGCLAVTFLGIIGIGAAVLVGGLALKRGVESTMGVVEEQQDATETLRRVEEEHPFEPPDDGVVREENVERFLAVTEEAWEAMRPWAEDLEQVRAAAEAGQGGATPRLRDLAAGARAVGGLARSRVVLAEALESHETSLAEYAWTGLSLSRAAEVRDGEAAPGSVPDANVELARRYGDRLPILDGDEEPGPGTVLAVATLWGLSELSTWRAMGLDTLMGR